MIGPVYNNYLLYFQSHQAPAGEMQNNVQKGPGSRNPLIEGPAPAEKNKSIGPKECKTCESRKYKDSSNDPSVSFQSPTSVPPQLAASAVSAHEQEHVRNNAIKAEEQGMKATSSVQIHTAICPECGKSYVSGGTTTTTFRPKQQIPVEENTTPGRLSIWA